MKLRIIKYKVFLLLLFVSSLARSQVSTMEQMREKHSYEKFVASVDSEGINSFVTVKGGLLQSIINLGNRKYQVSLMRTSNGQSITTSYDWSDRPKPSFSDYEGRLQSLIREEEREIEDLGFKIVEIKPSSQFIYIDAVKL